MEDDRADHDPFDHRGDERGALYGYDWEEPEVEAPFSQRQGSIVEPDDAT